jgi:putative ABC transport system permease protein
MHTLWQDVRYGLRMLAKSPGFTAIAVVTLALGIGANTAIFSITDQVLLRSLPVPHPEQLVELRSPGPNPGHYWSDGIQGSSFSYPMYQDIREKLTSAFSGLLATYPVTVDISGQGVSERVPGELVSGNYFEVLGVTPALGRTLSKEDATAPGANPVVVLSYEFWARHFGQDPNILNKTLDVNGQSLTIVGVARQGYDGIQIGSVPDLFIPITMKDQMKPGSLPLANRKDHWVQVLGRLKPGFDRKRAQAACAPTYRALLESELPTYKFSPVEAKRFVSKPLLLDPASQGRPILQLSAQKPLVTLMAIVGLVLLIACANLASLLAARGEARQREIAVRLALGGGRWRLVRQLLTEGLLLSLAGGLCGLLVASWTLKVIVASLVSGAQVAGLGANLDYRVLLFAFASCVLTTLLSSLAPALHATRTDVQSSLKEQGAGAIGGGGSVRMRQALIVAQVALTTVLLAVSGLFVKSLMQLDSTQLGMSPDHVLQFSIEPDLNRYSPSQTIQLFERFEERLRQLPGVRSVAMAMLPIFQNTDADANITAEGYTAKPDENTDCQWNYVSPGYFSAMGIPLLAGREFADADTASSPRVAIINRKLANRYFAGHNPVGMHIAMGGGNGVHPDIEIVGVVADSKHDDVRDPISPFMYFPYAQAGLKHTIPAGFGTFYVRTNQAPAALAGEVRQNLAGYDPRLPIFDVRTLMDQVDDSMFNDRLVTSFSLTLALLAALLAAVGLYGVTAYVVARRTREIGVRMALGAMTGDVGRMILWQAGRLALLGLAAGTAGAFGAAQLIQSLLYGVKADDPSVFAFCALLLMAVALAACWLPARRATKVDPMVALRYE